MIHVNKLDGGRRWLIESDCIEAQQHMILDDREFGQLAEALAFRLGQMRGLGRGGSGLVAKTWGGTDLHVAFSDEAGEVIESLNKEFAREIAEYRELG